MITVIRHKAIGNIVVMVITVLGNGNNFKAITSSYKVNSNETTVLIFEHTFSSEKLAIADFDQTCKIGEVK